MTIGPGGLVYLFVGALITAAAVYTQANLLFWALGLMVGGLLVSLVLSLLMTSRLRVERLLPAHGVTGDSLVLRYRIENASTWAPAFGLVICETWGRGRRGFKRTGPVAESPQRLRGRPFGWVMHVGPMQTVLADATCWPLRRGELKFERIVISTSFPFGVIRRTLVFEQQASVLVYPRLHRLHRRVIVQMSENDMGGQQQMDRGGNDEFFGLREYHPGESVRTIHWKHSAKTGQLVAREMTQPAPPRVMLALDLRGAAAHRGPAEDADGNDEKSGDEDRLERAISLAASVICDAHLHGYQIGLAILGASAPAFPVHHSLPHRTRLLEALARVDLTNLTARPQPLPARPSVVIVPGSAPPDRVAGNGWSPRHRVIVLHADQLDRYVAAEQGGTELLSDRLVMRPRRAQLQEARL